MIQQVHGKRMNAEISAQLGQVAAAVREHNERRIPVRFALTQEPRGFNLLPRAVAVLELVALGHGSVAAEAAKIVNEYKSLQRV